MCTGWNVCKLLKCAFLGTRTNSRMGAVELGAVSCLHLHKNWIEILLWYAAAFCLRFQLPHNPSCRCNLESLYIWGSGLHACNIWVIFVRYFLINLLAKLDGWRQHWPTNFQCWDIYLIFYFASNKLNVMAVVGVILSSFDRICVSSPPASRTCQSFH